jgi:hypothetical protein
MEESKTDKLGRRRRLELGKGTNLQWKSGFRLVLNCPLWLDLEHNVGSAWKTGNSFNLWSWKKWEIAPENMERTVHEFAGHR